MDLIIYISKNNSNGTFIILKGDINMKFLERTKTYSFGEFRVENNGDIMKLDKQLGIWSRTNKKLYRAIVVLVACSLIANSIPVLSANIEIYDALCTFSKGGVIVYVLSSCIWNLIFEGKKFLKLNFEEMFDGVAIYSVMIALATYLCSQVLI